MGRAVCHGRSGVAAASGLGECRAESEGVDAGGGERPLSRPDVFTAPRGARECPYKAHVRIVSGSLVPDGLWGGWRVRAPHIAHVRVLTRSAGTGLKWRGRHATSRRDGHVAFWLAVGRRLGEVHAAGRAWKRGGGGDGRSERRASRSAGGRSGGEPRRACPPRGATGAALPSWGTCPSISSGRGRAPL